MKGKRADTLAPSGTSKPFAKPQKRPARAKPASAARASGKKLRMTQNGAMPTPPHPTPPTSSPPPPPQQQQTHAGASSNFTLTDEVPLCFDGALELDGWCWDAVDEEKLLGWFPFGDEDFPCFWSENRGWSSGFFGEDYNDIWHLKHIHEIPSSPKANR